MNSNIYWPIFKNIESEFNNLMFNIHIDDNQLNVYSSKISDLILRASTEIESLSKELYKIYGGTKTINIKYDEDALTYLNDIWRLQEKKVILSSYNCFTTNKIIEPFKKSEVRTGSSRLTYSWNNSYQNLKHDRANSLNFGSVKYLIDVTAALYVLNIYYKKDVFDLNENANGSNFDNSLGSSIFSVMLHVNQGISVGKDYSKNQDFNECVYLLKPTDNTRDKVQAALKKMNEMTNERNKENLINEILKRIQPMNISSQEEIHEKLKEVAEKIKSDNMIQVAKENRNLLIDSFKTLRYEAILNTNQY
jgi:hypothetical protein